ncbi:dnaJ homolog subfamily C member 10-like isoform X1 [Acanthaster planci]|uniref:DnaJ homolog subfamily C member 10-like isoform X1 n=1 Tax=Acanthaster planci TaxID=133434 RepID=A0A8B7ZMN0_ACAPL|nr:dnaJ homolog subfamily C member 10-like isoform X1 [Acanthaster planci]
MKMAGDSTSSKCSFALTLAYLLFHCFVSCAGQGDEVIGAQEISAETFERKMEAGDLLLVNFIGPGCRNCKEFAPIFDQVNTELLKEKLDIPAVIINNLDIVKHYDFQKLPSLVFFRKTVPILYEGHHEVEEILAWLENTREVQGRFLNDKDFEHLTQASTGATTGDWLVQFCDPERPQCVALQTIWETVAYRLKDRINVATVDTTTNKALVKRFNIAVQKTPTVLLMKGQRMYRIHPKMLTGPADRLETWLSTGYKANKAINVPREWTRVDDLTEDIANKLKAVQPGGRGVFVLIVGSLVIFSLVLCKVFLKRGNNQTTGRGPKKGV